MKVALEGGHWHTNIGNAFFELGVRYVFSSLSSHPEVITFCQNQSYPFCKYNAVDSTVFRYVEKIADVDYVVYTGPLLESACLREIEYQITLFEQRKTKIVFMSAGGAKYDKQEVSEVSDFLNRHRIYALFSRDHETYENYHHLFEFAYDGICCAFFIPDYFTPCEMKSKFAVCNFEQYEEPIIQHGGVQRAINKGKCFTFDQKVWHINHIKKMQGKRWWWDIIHKVYQEKRPKRDLEFNNLKIVRTKHHDGMPAMRQYRESNIYISDVPYDYLNIYANADVVFTDRVHACVASLAQGTPVMLITDSPRSKLLDRVGAEKAMSEPTVLNFERIGKEKECLIKQLEKVII